MGEDRLNGLAQLYINRNVNLDVEEKRARLPHRDGYEGILALPEVLKGDNWVPNYEREWRARNIGLRQMLYDHNSLQNKQLYTANAVQQHVEESSSNKFNPQSQLSYSTNQPDSKQQFSTSKMNQNRRPYPAVRLAPQQQMNGGSRGHVNDLPIRMIINAKYVGAVIGQAGANIREICHASKAKCVIDITRSIREGNGNLVEKAVNVYGSLNNASGACIKILEIIMRESSNDPVNHGKSIETELKLLAHNNLIGRLIGKRGSTIRKIMDETACIIFISKYQARAMYSIPINPLPPISPLMFRASDFAPMTAAYGTAAINAYTMNSSYRQIPVYGQNVASPRHDTSQLSGQQNNKGTGRMNVTPNGIASSAVNPYDSYQTGRSGNTSPGRSLEISYVWVPGTAVGALIGTQGSNIRKIMRSSGARIHIDSPKPTTPMENNTGQQNGLTPTSKPETADQSPNAQMLKQVALANEVAPPNSKQMERRSQFWVFHRLSEDHYIYFDSMRLCIDIPIPGSVIGRIIGKKGYNRVEFIK
uniref:K Homology domain-containing protein n=1 Tax=Romanomermis culicivorax TaxID=13658 RepID=A0A915HSZ1_ROMCU